MQNFLLQNFTVEILAKFRLQGSHDGPVPGCIVGDRLVDVGKIFGVVVFGVEIVAGIFGGLLVNKEQLMRLLQGKQLSGQVGKR